MMLDFLILVVVIPSASSWPKFDADWAELNAEICDDVVVFKLLT